MASQQQNSESSVTRSQIGLEGEILRKGVTQARTFQYPQHISAKRGNIVLLEKEI